MKRKLIFILIAFSVFSFISTSCKKSANSLQASNPPVTTTLRFNWNDTVVDWSNTTSAISIRQVIRPEVPDTTYALVGTNDGKTSSFQGSLYIGLNVSSLNVGLWSNEVHVAASRYPTPGQLTFGGNDALPENRLSISNIHDGMVDGSFQAVLTGFGYKVNITEGTFRNVRILGQDTRQ